MRDPGPRPLYLANEGKLVAIVPAARAAERRSTAMRAHPAGRDAALIGEVRDAPRARCCSTRSFGGARIVDMLVGEQLPRIC